MKQTFFIITALTLLLCAGPASAAPSPQDRSLYDDLGSKQGITVIVDTMLGVIADDVRIVHYFADSNIRHARHGLIMTFCEISGGPCRYTGESMRDVHRGLHVTAAAFNALVEDLQTAMTKLKVPVTVQNRLLAKLVPMRNDIVEASGHD